MKYIFIILSLCITLKLQAQDSPKAAGNISSMSTADSSGITLKEVTISVNKVAETKKSVAQQVSILSAKEIENTQAQSTADLLSASGAASVQKSQQGGGSP